jgi:hypothetical protein
MRRAMSAVCAMLLLSAGRAGAATLRIYASFTGPVGGVLAAPPPEYTSHVNPSATFYTTFHLSAAVMDAGTWNGISLTYTGNSGPVNLVNSSFLGLRR